MKVMVTGGAGYIGSVMVARLLSENYDVVVIDNLWRGHRQAVGAKAPLVRCDLTDPHAVETSVRTHRPDAIVHFAAASLVPESVTNPALYFRVNVAGSLNLLEAMRAADVGRIVFSSSAAVYGEPATTPIEENAPLRPINPYGQSKAMVERMLSAYVAAYHFQAASLRYFNVAGATAALGEDHEPETHVIPVAIDAALGKREHFAIFGTDYPTPDGTAVRDYVHVIDLVDAHLRALQRLDQGLGAINLGTREGISVRQIVSAVERVTGRPLPVSVAPRRPGDPPTLVADSTKARTLLGWSPLHSTVDEMVMSAWNWQRRHPNGYEKEFRQ